jgi:hypothetical protein
VTDIKSASTATNDIYDKLSAAMATIAAQSAFITTLQAQVVAIQKKIA